MPTKTMAVRPLALLEDALPKTSNRDLYALALSLLDEAPDRAENYSSLRFSEEESEDAINEGLAFVSRFDELYFGWGDVFGNDPVGRH